jgi:hypothetical protein
MAFRDLVSSAGCGGAGNAISKFASQVSMTDNRRVAANFEQVGCCALVTDITSDIDHEDWC